MEQIDSLTLLKKIIDYQMQMPEGRVFAYNGEQSLPKDSDLFICMYYVQKSPYASKLIYETRDDSFVEKQAVNMVEDIEIAIMSRSTDAISRCHEVLMALNSTYAQQLQESNHFHIAKLGNILDNSFLEETSNLNRFDIKCRIIRVYNRVGSVDYYDKFPNTSKFEPEYHIEN